MNDRAWFNEDCVNSLLTQLRTANITPILKGSSPSQFPLNYIDYEKLIFRRLYKFVDSIEVFPHTQFGFRKGLGTTDAFQLLIHDLQSSLDKQAEL